jgi:hypothetical protein
VHSHDLAVTDSHDGAATSEGEGTVAYITVDYIAARFIKAHSSR